MMQFANVIEFIKKLFMQYLNILLEMLTGRFIQDLIWILASFPSLSSVSKVKAKVISKDTPVHVFIIQVIYLLNLLKQFTYLVLQYGSYFCFNYLNFYGQGREFIKKCTRKFYVSENTLSPTIYFISRAQVIPNKPNKSRSKQVNFDITTSYMPSKTVIRSQGPNKKLGLILSQK